MGDQRTNVVSEKLEQKTRMLSSGFKRLMRRNGANALDAAPSNARQMVTGTGAINQPSEGTGGGDSGRLFMLSFVFLVLFPTVIALFYYAAIASSVYVAEAKLLVRSAPKTNGSSTSISDVAGSFIGKLGLGKSGTSEQDSRIILDYVKSLAAIEDIGGKDQLARYYDLTKIDYFSRMDSSETIEEIRAYWLTKVSATVDTQSNILTLKVSAYEPEDALDLAKRIVASSERLINELSVRSRTDALERAKGEVERSMSGLANARLELLKFQQANKLIDPVQSAKQITSLIATLTGKKIELESELAVADTSGVSGRPGDRYLQTRVDVLKQQISDLENLLTGKEEGSVSLQLKDFELLKLRLEFEEQIYTLSRASFEEARRNVDKQQLYLMVVVPPTQPETALYPRVFSDAGMVFLGCFVFWAIGALLVASIRDSMQL